MKENDEARMTNYEGMAKPTAVVIRKFELVSSFVIRISSFPAC